MTRGWAFIGTGRVSRHMAGAVGRTDGAQLHGVLSRILLVTCSRISVQPAVHGVSMKPGAIALTRTSGPSVEASRRVRWSTAALLTE